MIRFRVSQNETCLESLESLSAEESTAMDAPSFSHDEAT